VEPTQERSAPVARGATNEERLEQRDERLVQVLEALARAEAAPARPRRNWDVYAAVIASLVGLLALAVSAYTAYVQDQQLRAQDEQLRAQGEQLRAQVWPHLRLSFSGANVWFMALNEGTGPAWIVAMRVTMHDKPRDKVIRGWQQVGRAAGFTEEFAYSMSSFSGTVLPPGKEMVLAEAKGGEHSRAQFAELFPHGSHPLSITVCYCSIFRDCWIAESTVEDRKEKIDIMSPDFISPEKCPIRSEERFKD
jgi:hypothetical protein